MRKSASTIILVISDCAAFALSILLSYLLHFDFEVPVQHVDMAITYWPYFLLCILVKILVNHFSGLYRSILDYAGVYILRKVITAVVISTIICISPAHYFHMRIPRSIPLIIGILDLILILAVRYALVLLRFTIKNRFSKRKKGIRTLIIGGGNAGTMIIKELKSNPTINHRPVGIIDDDINKIGKNIAGVPIIGTRDDIVRIVKALKIEEIVITLPSARKKDVKEIINICSSLEVKIKMLPSVEELISGNVQYSLARDIKIEDLLGRNPLELDNQGIEKIIKDKVILVTGAGGSIGSEIVRNVTQYSPKKVVLLDFYESGAYEVAVELRRKYPEVTLHIAVCSIQEYDLLNDVFKTHKPNVVFHAAAHKHVPLMEKYPIQAIRNNILGTYNVVDIAHKNNVERMVMISTDKAVNPTNVMGATKQFAEKIVNSYTNKSKTLYSVVRFGNVLGSNGSVVPIFKKQIDEGGPVTVTHKDVVRFFMTIPEAVSLVIEACAMSEGGETFVLDMGEPVKLYDLATKLIRLYGHTPNQDIDIKITGLRPGEKLYEELLMQDESLKSTHNKSVFISDQRIYKYDEIQSKLHRVRELAAGCCAPIDIRKFLKDNVDGYEINFVG